MGWLWQDGKERGGSACVSTLVGTSGRAEISCDLQECAGYCFFFFFLLQNRREAKLWKMSSLPHSFHSFVIVGSFSKVFFGHCFKKSTLSTTFL